MAGAAEFIIHYLTITESLFDDLIVTAYDEDDNGIVVDVNWHDFAYEMDYDKNFYRDALLRPSFMEQVKSELIDWINHNNLLL